MANISNGNLCCENANNIVKRIESKSDDVEVEAEKLPAKWNKSHENNPHEKKVQLTVSDLSDCDREISISPNNCERSMTYSSESQKTNMSNCLSDTSFIDTSQINSIDSFTGTDEYMYSESVSASGKSYAEKEDKILYARCVVPRRTSSGFSVGLEREFGTVTDISSTELTTNSEVSKYTSNDYDDYEESGCGSASTDGRSDPDGISLTLDRPVMKNITKKSRIPIFDKKVYLKRYNNNTTNARKCERICESDMASNASESMDGQIKSTTEPTAISASLETAETQREDVTKKLKNDASYIINATLELTAPVIIDEHNSAIDTDKIKSIIEPHIIEPDNVNSLSELKEIKVAPTTTELDFTKDLCNATIQNEGENTIVIANRPPEVESSTIFVKKNDLLPSAELSEESIIKVTSEDIKDTTSLLTANESQSSGGHSEGVSLTDCACVTSDFSKVGMSEELVAADNRTSSVELSKESELLPAPPASQQSEELCQADVKPSKEKQTIVVKEKEDEPPQLTLTQDEWERRENALLLKIIDLERQKDNASIEGIRMQLKVREEENDLLKHKVRSLESELKAVLNSPDSNKNKKLVADIKTQHEEFLAKARAMIFEKTKMVRNQELQIEALSGQVFSLKEVVAITKDLLGIRNMEVKNLRDRLDTTEEKILSERERQKLLMSKVDLGMKKNEELRNEYTNQLSLFKEVREKYEAKVDDLRVENKKLAEQIGDFTKKF